MIHTVTSCVLPRTPLMSRTRSHTLSFLGSAAYTAMILISFRSPMRCVNSLQNVSTLALLSPVHWNIDRETALKPTEPKTEERIPFTSTYHPDNLEVKNILRSFKLFQIDYETASIFKNTSPFVQTWQKFPQFPTKRIFTLVATPAHLLKALLQSPDPKAFSILATILTAPLPTWFTA